MELRGVDTPSVVLGLSSNEFGSSWAPEPKLLASLYAVDRYSYLNPNLTLLVPR